MNLRRTRVRLPILALVSVLVLAGTGMVGVASTSAASSGLVGYWALDDLVGSTSAVDSSGNGNNAACGGVAYIGSGQNRFADCPSFGAPGLVGTSAGFDGSDDFLYVGNIIPDSFTVAAWIKTTDSGGGWGPAYSGHGIIWSDVGGGANDMIPMAVVNGNLAFGTGENCPYYSYDTLTSTVPINTGQWVHVAVTRDEATGTKQIFINGKLNATNGNGGNCPLNANPIIAFGSNPLDYRFLNGQMDEVYFYNRVLSPSEILSFTIVPFAAFTPKLEIADAQAFEVKGPFTLGATSDGIHPVTEDVTLQIGTFSLTIPAGSFRVSPARSEEEHHHKKGKPRAQFEFEGVIDGVSLEAKLTQTGTNTFEFKAEGQNANLSGVGNPVPVGLTIGNDGGSVAVTTETESE